MSALAAARITDPTGHGAPSAGAMALGGLAGAALGATIAGPVGALVGALAGAGLGALLSLMPGSILGPCSPSAKIRGLKAARVTDQNRCGVVWHAPSSITSGSGTVLFDGLPAARVTDTIFCGAQITGGCKTVLIGGPTEVFPLNVVGSQDFIRQVQASLATLYATPSGKLILQGIAASGHTVTIQATADDNGYCTANDGADAKIPGKGTGSVVEWNPTHAATQDGGLGHTVTLGHELVHAYHNATGTNANGPYDSYPGQPGASARGEERQTVGTGGTSITTPSGATATVPDYSQTSPTENSIRDDLGLPRRPTYYPQNWPGGPPW